MLNQNLLGILDFNFDNNWKILSLRIQIGHGGGSQMVV